MGAGERSDLPTIDARQSVTVHVDPSLSALPVLLA